MNPRQAKAELRRRERIGRRIAQLERLMVAAAEAESSSRPIFASCSPDDAQELVSLWSQRNGWQPVTAEQPQMVLLDDSGRPA